MLTVTKKIKKEKKCRCAEYNLENGKKHPILGVWYTPYKKFPEGPIVLGGPRWVNFQKWLRKLGFVDYTKNESEITYPRLRTFRKKIGCVLSFQAICTFSKDHSHCSLVLHLI